MCDPAERLEDQLCTEGALESVGPVQRELEFWGIRACRIGVKAPRTGAAVRVNS